MKKSLIPSSGFKWWYCIVGMLSYYIAVFVNTLIMSFTVTSNEGAGLNGAIFNNLQFVIAGILCMGLIRLVSQGKLHRKDLGIGSQRNRKALIVGIVGGLVYFLCGEAFEYFIPTLQYASDSVAESLHLGVDLKIDILIFVGVGLFAPVVEELIFRGVVFSALAEGLKNKIDPKIAFLTGLVVSAYAFVSIHGGEGQDAQFWMLGILSLFAAGATYFSKSLLSGVYVHAVNNNIVLLFIVLKYIGFDTFHGQILSMLVILNLIVCFPLLILFCMLLPQVTNK